MSPTEDPDEGAPRLTEELRQKCQEKIIRAIMGAPMPELVDWPGLLNAVATRMEGWDDSDLPPLAVYEWARRARIADVTSLCGLTGVSLRNIGLSWGRISDQFADADAGTIGAVVARFATGEEMSQLEAVAAYGSVSRASIHERLVLVDICVASLKAIHFPPDEFRVLRT